MTVDAFADMEVVLLRPLVGLSVGLAAEFNDEDEDKAEPAAP
jgi:hypothetical protein